ncbi:hypothetical protein KGF54_005167 [Candida jiufengensis]|uniref:uncharacterized protein n=1 Tax=Candida jiufengensis TaxID=497108 RepID=UPI002224E4AA|nr:uncharacterized protein KGF54_005167 [Candida jiufengensis]KAI5950350.1 hypothetical protein KGF54_005167 [Candida jiufengensis]
MDNYNQLLLQQLNPYLRIHIQSNLKNNEIIDKLISQFNINNVKTKKWDNCIIRNRLSTPKYILDIDFDENLKLPKKEKIPDQHDLLSPFNTQSDIFPNGILTYKWFEKYITRFPFAVCYICEVSNEGDEEEVLQKDDELILNFKKLKIELEEIDSKLVLLLISDNKAIDENRITRIRTELNFPKTGHLYNLINTKETIDRDIEVLINSMFSNLTKLSHDFYANIEYKIKQRYKKYYSCPSTDEVDTSIELTPKFLEIRNLIKQAIILEIVNINNLEPSIKLLEVAYQDLISLLDSIYAVNLSDHDNKVIAQMQTLLDTIAFHIVRGYFAIEEPIKALKKHKTHIINVVQIIKEDHKWISIQYEWLAELMNLIPYSIITYLNTSAVLKSKNNNGSNLVSFSGGIHTPEFDLITNPGLIYLKSFELNTDSSKRIELLQKSMESLESIQSQALNKSSVSGNDESGSLISYINWLLGEEFFQIGDYKKASDFLEMSYSSMGIGKWLSISEVILLKLLRCYSKLGNKKLELNTVLKLSTFPQHFKFNDEISNLCENIFQFDDDIVELDLLNSKLHELFDVNVLLLNKNVLNDKKDESSTSTSVGDEIILQIDLKSKINLSVLKTLLPPETDICISIKQIDAPFTRTDKLSKKRGLKYISISHDSSKTKPTTNVIKLKGQELDQTFVDSTNLEINDIPKTLQHEQIITSAGNYQIEVIKLQIMIEIKHQNILIRLNKIELHQSSSLGHYKNNIGYLKLDNTTIPKMIRLNESNRSINVIPKIPIIEINPLNEIDYYIIGEKLSIPTNIEFDSKDLKQLKKAELVVEIKSKNSIENIGGDEISLFWDNLKDDEPLNLLTLGENENIISLNVFSRQFKAELMNLQFLLIISDEDEDEGDEEDNENEKDTKREFNTHIHKIQDLEIPILSKPFKCQYFIIPNYNEDLKFPPYIEGQQQPPILKREWQLLLKTSDLLNQLNSLNQFLEIEDVEFNIMSKNPEISINLLEDIENDNQNNKRNQLFLTECKNGFSHRNVEIIVSGTIKWKRSTTTTTSTTTNTTTNQKVNEYIIPEWTTILSLCSPRVLLNITEIYSKTTFKFKYILENPTPQLLNFTSQLIDLKEWKISKYNKDDDINPKQQFQFTVKPVTNYIIEFHLDLEISSLSSLSSSLSAAKEKEIKLIKLPKLQIFDINYKIDLHVLSTQTNVIYKDGSLYYVLQ